MRLWLRWWIISSLADESHLHRWNRNFKLSQKEERKEDSWDGMNLRSFMHAMNFCHANELLSCMRWTSAMNATNFCNENLRKLSSQPSVTQSKVDAKLSPSLSLLSSLQCYSMMQRCLSRLCSFRSIVNSHLPWMTREKKYLISKQKKKKKPSYRVEWLEIEEGLM